MDNVDFYGVKLLLSGRLESTSKRIPLKKLLSVLELTLLAEFTGKYFKGDYSNALREHLESLINQPGYKYFNIVYQDTEMHILLSGRTIVNMEVEPGQPPVREALKLLGKTPLEVSVYQVHIPIAKTGTWGLIPGETKGLIEEITNALNGIMLSIIEGELDELEQLVKRFKEAVSRLEALVRSKTISREVRKACEGFSRDAARLLDLYRRGDFIGFLNNALIFLQALAYSCSTLKSG